MQTDLLGRHSDSVAPSRLKDDVEPTLFRHGAERRLQITLDPAALLETAGAPLRVARQNAGIEWEVWR